MGYWILTIAIETWKPLFAEKNYAEAHLKNLWVNIYIDGDVS